MFDPVRQASALDIQQTTTPRQKPSREAEADLPFGHVFSDHMFKAEWSEKSGWAVPRIEAYGNLSLSPAAPALHYAVEVGRLLGLCGDKINRKMLQRRNTLQNNFFSLVWQEQWTCACNIFFFFFFFFLNT